MPSIDATIRSHSRTSSSRVIGHKSRSAFGNIRMAFETSSGSTFSQITPNTARVACSTSMLAFGGSPARTWARNSSLWRSFVGVPAMCQPSKNMPRSSIGN